jgi:D-glycero-alpha-D-manno-heptose-7-phosphate kinase
VIITQTPLRISFAGGGTDFRSFYAKDAGAVVSTAIDKYVYVIIKERFDSKIRVGYSRTEMVDSVDQVEHELVRECLRKTGITQRVEIATMADIPSEGSGLGSSGSVTVGLLNAMYTYQGIMKTAEDLAREACEIENDILKKPGGKQDQYIAAFGNVRLIEFLPDETVRVEQLDLSEEDRRRLSENLLLFYTGVTRRASTILTQQAKNTAARMDVLRTMKQQAYAAYEAISSKRFSQLGAALAEAWEQKKHMAESISNPEIDSLYKTACEAGALGGKIAGAGGGGFLLVYCPPGKQAALRAALRGYRELPFNLERDGTKVIFNVRR